jgi:hypothetical protein
MMFSGFVIGDQVMEKKWTENYLEGILSEEYVENVINAYLYKGRSLKWVGSMLEIWSSSEELLKDPEKRKEEISRAINRYGMERKEKLISEMMGRKLI